MLFSRSLLRCLSMPLCSMPCSWCCSHFSWYLAIPALPPRRFRLRRCSSGTWWSWVTSQVSCPPHICCFAQLPSRLHGTCICSRRPMSCHWAIQGFCRPAATHAASDGLLDCPRAPSRTCPLFQPAAENYMNISHQTLEVMRFAAADPAVTHVLKVGRGAELLDCCCRQMEEQGILKEGQGGEGMCSADLAVTHVLKVNWGQGSRNRVGGWRRDSTAVGRGLGLPMHHSSGPPFTRRWTTIHMYISTACSTASPRCPGVAGRLWRIALCCARL